VLGSVFVGLYAGLYLLEIGAPLTLAAALTLAIGLGWWALRVIRAGAWAPEHAKVQGIGYDNPRAMGYLTPGSSGS
jgi:hypothetical protein